MNSTLHFIPVAFSVLIWVGINRVNKQKNWFRTGEIIFWDIIILIIVFLFWLKWF